MEANQELDYFALLPFLLFLFTIGVVCICRGYKSILFFIDLGRRGQSVRGQVLGLKEHAGGRVSGTHRILSFQVNGKWYEVEGDQLLLEESFSVGQKIGLRFLPENPRKCTWRKTCLTAIGLMLLGLILVVPFMWLLIKN